MTVHVSIELGTDKYRIEGDKAYDQCPQCEQWYARPAATLGPWKCEKCKATWGQDLCPCLKGGVFCGGLFVQIGEHQTCLSCGHQPAAETPPAAIDWPDVLTKLGFEPSEGGEFVLKGFIRPNTPGRGPGRFEPTLRAHLYAALTTLRTALANAVNGIPAAAYNDGFTQGMLHTLHAQWSLQEALDDIIRRAVPGQIITYAGTTWACDRVGRFQGRDEAFWKSAVGGDEVLTRRGSLDDWGVILKSLFDDTRIRDLRPPTSMKRPLGPVIVPPADRALIDESTAILADASDDEIDEAIDQVVPSAGTLIPTISEDENEPDDPENADLHATYSHSSRESTTPLPTNGPAPFQHVMNGMGQCFTLTRDDIEVE